MWKVKCFDNGLEVPEKEADNQDQANNSGTSWVLKGLHRKAEIFEMVWGNWESRGSILGRTK